MPLLEARSQAEPSEEVLLGVFEILELVLQQAGEASGPITLLSGA